MHERLMRLAMVAVCKAMPEAPKAEATETPVDEAPAEESAE